MPLQPFLSAGPCFPAHRIQAVVVLMLHVPPAKGPGVSGRCRPEAGMFLKNVVGLISWMHDHPMCNEIEKAEIKIRMIYRKRGSFVVMTGLNHGFGFFVNRIKKSPLRVLYLEFFTKFIKIGIHIGSLITPSIIRRQICQMPPYF